MANENPGQTLQPTALVHEARLKLVGQRERRWQNRNHFFAAAAEGMRRILTDNARRKLSLRRGGISSAWNSRIILVQSVPPTIRCLLSSDALEKFVRLDPQRAEVVKLRYFIGLSFAEVAEVLGISEITAKRYWAFARA